MTDCVRSMFGPSGRWRLEPFIAIGGRRDQSGFEAELLGDGTKSARAVLSRTWIVRRTPMTLYGRVVVLDGSITLVFDDKLAAIAPVTSVASVQGLCMR